MDLDVYRVYASAPRSVEKLPIASLKQEIHIVLAFARDYDSAGKYQTGKFEPYFDTGNFSAEKIQDIKNSARGTNIKFFLSIGNRDHRFPFQVTSIQQPQWVITATDYLKHIINIYNFDGIDVYYERITPNAVNQFAKSIRDVVYDLKFHSKVIEEASITVSAPHSKAYHDLYKGGTAVFDYVVYQTHTETSRISTFDELEQVFDRLHHRYHRKKIFAGHSDVLPTDWDNVPPPIFLGTVPKLLDAQKVLGISKWIVTPNDHNPEK